MILVRILGLDGYGLPSEDHAYPLVGDRNQPVRVHLPGSGEELTFNRAQQMISGAGWRTQKLRDQGNKRLDYMISTVRRFDTMRENFRFRFGLARADDADCPHPMKGRIIVRCQEGVYFAEEMLDGALILVAAAVPSGLSLAITYGIKAAAPELYRSGQVVSITAQTASGATKGEILILYTDITVDTGRLYCVSDIANFDYVVDVENGYPAIYGNLAYITGLMVDAGHDAEYEDLVGIHVRTGGAGGIYTVDAVLYDMEGTYFSSFGAYGTGTASEEDVITIGGVTITADSLD